MVVQPLIAMLAVASTPICDVTAYGAVADNDVLDTRAVQTAIDACAAGGGTVMVPRGAYTIGTLHLRDGTHLHLDTGARLVASRDLSHYPVLEKGEAPGHAATPFRALIFADRVRDVQISGDGTIDGQGDAFWDRDFYASGLARPTTERPYPWIVFADCRDVSVDGITLTNSPSYHLRFERCDGMRVRGVTIAHDFRSPNTDGINMSDTSNVRISDCRISTGDDAIAITSSRRDVANIRVENCALESDDAAVKIGPRTAFNVSDVVASDLTITRTRYGLAIFMADGGTVRDVVFRDISIATGSRHPRDYPIFVDIDRRSPADPLGRIEDVRFERIAIRSSGNMLIAGQPDAPIRRLTLSDIGFAGGGAVDLIHNAGKPRGNVTFGKGAGTRDYSNIDADMVAAHVEGLRIERLVNDGASGRQAIARIDASE